MTNLFNHNSPISKIVFNDKDMRDFGIKFLTGEACAISMRILCELDENAMHTYLEYTGIDIPFDQIRKSGYNDSSKYAVYLTFPVIQHLIIMMLLKDPEIDAVLLLHDVNKTQRIEALAGKYEEIKERIADFPHVYGWFDPNAGKYGEYFPGEYYTTGRWYRLMDNGQPRRGFGNVHAMSGASK